MPPRVSLVVLIAAGSLLAAACGGSPSIAAAPGGAAPRPMAQASPAVTRTPSGIFVSTRVPPTAAIATATLEADPDAVVVQGRVYDAGRGQRLNNATIDWQFLSPDWQRHNGRLQVPADGLYRLQLPIRSEDEVIITAQAPGYQPSMARLLGRQLSLYGSRLNFGLVAADGPAPTLPGALGTIPISGIVYNAAHGHRDPLANARVTLVARSVVRPKAELVATTSVSGTFLIPVALHATDQVDVKVTASGYQTVTLTRSATELARRPQLAIGLQPAPKP